ncbi:MAG: hypothetical protein V1644_01125 [Candidatus Micrarchaeota archaeon]
MNIITILGVILISFFSTLFVIPYFMRFFNRIGIIGTDQQKRGTPIIPQAGGIPVFFGFLLGVLILVSVNTFVSETQLNLLAIFAALLSTSVIAMTGFFDDLNVRTQKVAISSDAVDFRVGLKQWQKPLLTLAASIPLIAINAGVSSANLPLLGFVDFGIFYPLIVIPIAVVCVSNATNMLAGINGIEAGMSSVALTGLGIFLLQNSAKPGAFEGAVIAFCAAAALLAFLKFNWFPAKMFPGDSLTYFAGAALVSVIVIGNAEKLGILLFTPWMIEALLKLRGKFKVRSYGDLQKDGTIKAPYPKIYSLTHVAMRLPYWLGMKKGFTEKQIATVLIAGEIILTIAVLMFYSMVTY